jgi:hypothetical protein
MLTISKPHSAGQQQSYHQKEFTARSRTIGRNAAPSPANGKAVLPGRSACPKRSRPRTLRNSASERQSENET